MPLEGTDFVDTDLRPGATPTPRSPAPRQPSLPAAGRAPTREELDGQLTATQQELARLREAQEQLERARAAIEEMRRRRAEFQTGREEALRNLLRGVGLLEQAEHNHRREAQQMAKSLEGLRAALANVQALDERAWNDATWETELSRSLATIENARMEWNQARLNWPVLDGKEPASTGAAPSGPAMDDLAGLGMARLAKLGLAFNWPLLLLGLLVLVLTLVIAFRR